MSKGELYGGESDSSNNRLIKYRAIYQIIKLKPIWSLLWYSVKIMKMVKVKMCDIRLEWEVSLLYHGNQGI